MEYLDKRIQLRMYKLHERTSSDQDIQTFPGDELLGWFYINMIDQTPNAVCVAIQDQLAQSYDVPVLVVFSHLPPGSVPSRLPIKAYEVVYKSKSETGEAQFVEIHQIKIESEEAERIGVDDVVRGADTSNGKTLATHLTNEINAMEMLSKRLQVVLMYVRAVSDGTLPADRQLLRQINSFVSQITRDHYYQSHDMRRALDDQELYVWAELLVAAVAKSERLTMDMSTKLAMMIHGLDGESVKMGDLM
jgi:hypothetical protein